MCTCLRYDCDGTHVCVHIPEVCMIIGGDSHVCTCLRYDCDRTHMCVHMPEVCMIMGGTHMCAHAWGVYDCGGLA